MLRRTLLCLTPAAVLAACTKTTTNGATTITIDTKRIDVDGTAILQALNAMLAAPSISVLLGPNLVTAEAAIAAAQASLASFDEMTGGSMSATYDPTQVQATIISFISDVQQVLSVVQQVIPKISSSAVATAIGNYTAAVQALLVFVQVAASLSKTSITAKPVMTEAQALKIATH